VDLRTPAVSSYIATILSYTSTVSLTYIQHLVTHSNISSHTGVISSHAIVIWSHTAAILDCVWNVMAHGQEPDFVFRLNGRVHLNRWLVGGWWSGQSTTGRRAVHISLQGLHCSCKPVFCSHASLTGYPLHSIVSPSLLLPCHHISNAVYHILSSFYLMLPPFYHTKPPFQHIQKPFRDIQPPTHHIEYLVFGLSPRGLYKTPRTLRVHENSLYLTQCILFSVEFS
jgi:hypothetical protein